LNRKGGRRERVLGIVRARAGISRSIIGGEAPVRVGRFEGESPNSVTDLTEKQPAWAG